MQLDLGLTRLDEHQDLISIITGLQREMPILQAYIAKRSMLSWEGALHSGSMETVPADKRVKRHSSRHQGLAFCAANSPRHESEALQRHDTAALGLKLEAPFNRSS